MGSGGAAQIPTSFGHELGAYLRCRLVKTYDQFRESGCENCPFFKMDEDHERCSDCTTPNFNGPVISVLVPGLITLYVNEDTLHDIHAATLSIRYIGPRDIALIHAKPL
ncbi:hypothetical protein K2173_006614 [Erythroxylum novogranatense]|uniref:Spt4/RpoE2 zinc finger domain-containing protein n=1 Tax=Erythroxylum novogranatense TaxID=1862640 RepID=A0AAV8T5F5_9ROSI|nr:hypothetical protein K2173_006614 [Erythroxylum novogranatense]